ncbi:MAG: hypothetical protein ACTHM6_02860, partial [Tepidisphaeraceae bacterium]
MKSKQFLLWALAISCAAASPARVLADQLADELATSVEQLPTATADQRLKKAVLAWALEDAQAEEQIGQRAFADAVRTDVRRALTQQIGVKHDTPANLFPAIPESKTNPYAVEAIKRARKLIAAKTAFVKGPAGAIVKDERGWHFPTIAVEALALTRALCHPQSELAGDPTIIAPMLRRFATVYEYLTPGSKQLVDFGDSAELAEMYLLLRTVYPDLILPTYKAAWEKAITTNSDAIAKQYGDVFREATPGTAYPNAHVRYMNALLFAGLIFQRPEYRELADGALKLLDSALYPDGAFCYIARQNECLTYHGINLDAVARFNQVTGEPRAAQMVARTRWYYPLSVEPPGVVEYSTAPSWHAYWNMVTGGASAYIVAGTTGDAQNYRLAQTDFSSPDLEYATYFRPDLKAAPAPDNYIVYDRNIQGARGRFGTFSFSSTARNFGDDNRGKSTYVGCMQLDSSSPKPEKWPLNAALQDAACEVRIKPGPDAGNNRSSTHLWLAQKEINASLASEHFAALSTRYLLSAYKTKAFDWAGRQAWLMTPQRLVGLVEIESLKTQQAFGVDGNFVFVSGRNQWGHRKEFQKLSDQSYQYGKLIATIRQHDFSAFATEYTDMMNGDTKKAGRLLLLDTLDANNTAPITYPAGKKHFYLVEIRPESSAPATSIERLDTTDGTLGFVVTEGS